MTADYENPWIFEGHPFLSEDINDYFGFVYRITNLQSGRQYIGRKYFWQHRKLEVEVGELKVRAIGKNTTEADELNRERKSLGNDAYGREILSVHLTKGTCNFEETKQLFLHNVLTESLDDGTPLYYNSNILGRYMRKDYFKTQYSVG